MSVVNARLLDLVDEQWAAAFGCAVELVREPGAHVVAGGAAFEGYNAVYMARIDETVLVYCPVRLRQIAVGLLDRRSPGEVFTPDIVERIAGAQLDCVKGPAWHGFLDAGHFVASSAPLGLRLAPGDPRLGELRRDCGEDEWAEAGFPAAEGVVYGVDKGGQLAGCFAHRGSWIADGHDRSSSISGVRGDRRRATRAGVPAAVAARG